MCATSIPFQKALYKDIPQIHTLYTEKLETTSALYASPTSYLQSGLTTGHAQKCNDANAYSSGWYSKATSPLNKCEHSSIPLTHVGCTTHYYHQGATVSKCTSPCISVATVLFWNSTSCQRAFHCTPPGAINVYNNQMLT